MTAHVPEQQLQLHAQQPGPVVTQAVATQGDHIAAALMGLAASAFGQTSSVPTHPWVASVKVEPGVQQQSLLKDQQQQQLSGNWAAAAAAAVAANGRCGVFCLDIELLGVSVRSALVLSWMCSHAPAACNRLHHRHCTSKTLRACGYLCLLHATSAHKVP
jgi:hypothetical protein